MKNRIIRTGLKGKLAKDICNSIIGQMSDGYWENTNRYEKYWRFIKVKTLSDNTIAFEVSSKSFDISYHTKMTLNNEFFYMRDSEILSFIANKIKFICIKELASNGMKLSKKYYNEKSKWLSYNDDVTVKDIVNVIDSLQAAALVNGIAESSCD